MNHLLRRLLLLSLALTFAWSTTGCSDSDGSDTTLEPGPWYEPEVGTPERIAYDMGVLRYLNAAEPVEVRNARIGTAYTFDQADGPACLRGLPYSASILDRESEDLVIFMQGGGACWSDFCLAVRAAPAGVPTTVNILSPTLEQNPVKDWNILYMPYCDGSLFVGDNVIEEEDGRTRIHAGLHNTSAALSMAYRQYPSPRRIMLAGSSGGAYGTAMVAFIVRYIWPDAPIYIVADSGLGIAHEGNRAFIDKLIGEFNAEAFLPEDCPTCGDDGHISDLTNYLLERDDNVKVAVFSSWYDSILSEVFLRIDPIDYQESLERATTAIHERHPEKYRRFIVDDITHTAMLGNVSGIVGSDPINGVELPPGMSDLLATVKIGLLADTNIGDLNLGDWLGHMLADSDEWVDILETPSRVRDDESDDE